MYISQTVFKGLQINDSFTTFTRWLYFYRCAWNR